MERKYEALFSLKAEVFNMRLGGCMWPGNLFNRVLQSLQFFQKQIRKVVILIFS